MSKSAQVMLLEVVNRHQPTVRYHRHYNNEKYMAAIMAKNLDINYANMLIDLALMICGDPFYNNSDHRQMLWDLSDDLALEFLACFAED